MQLIGYLDSPYVRRVAVSADLMGIPIEHRELSIFRDFDAFRAINPLVKVPTLILDDGSVLVDSGLILDHLEDQAAPDRRLMPDKTADLQNVRRLLGIMLVALEKAVALIYERHHRPEEARHGPWIERLLIQLQGACDLLEAELDGVDRWLFGGRMLQPDVTLAVAWTFIQARWPEDVPAASYPLLSAFTARAEKLESFARYSF
jgi:glutathione S-transferase